MPRDLEFDDEVLVACFHRAFGLLDSSGVVDEKLMEKLGKEWYSYNSRLSIEVMDVIAQARDKPKSAMPKPGT